LPVRKNWKLETGDWKLETDSKRLRLETHFRPKLELSWKPILRGDRTEFRARCRRVRVLEVGSIQRAGRLGAELKLTRAAEANVLQHYR
jgi:hypothetical protein